MAERLSDLSDLAREERIFLTAAQSDFPLVPRPYAALGEQAGISEHSVIERLTALKASGLVRRIGPIFEPARLGLLSELLAAEVAPADLEAAGAAVGAWPEVTHCYAREHRVNLWFAAIAPGADWFASAAARCASLPGVKGVWRLPALHRFKLTVRFDLVSGLSGSRAPNPKAQRAAAAPAAPSADPVDAGILQAVEADLPLCPEPFAALASGLSLDGKELLQVLRRWVAAGLVRRYGLLLNHRRLGFSANSMTVWALPPDRLEAAGRCLASSPEVSHCYQRPTFVGFPYNLYAMIHAPSREQCAATAHSLSNACGIGEPAMLFSQREFRKTVPSYSELLAQHAMQHES